MAKKVSSAILIACFFIVVPPPIASGGIEPSPFKVYLAQTIEEIIVRVDIMAPPGTSVPGGPGGGIDPAQIIARLQAIADSGRNVTNAVLAKNALGVMERITAVFFGPQPEPPRILRNDMGNLVPPALKALDALITLGFETPREMISLATESSRLLERITARFFGPQPEPPMPSPLIVGAGINIISGISRLTLETATEERTSAKTAIGILSQIDAVLFGPQPEPPELVIPMINILDQMMDLYFEITRSAVGQ